MNPRAADVESRLAERSRQWSLTPRQQEVLRLLVQGASNKEIAVGLGCSVKTVEAHITATLEKAGVDSRGVLVADFWMDAPRG